MLRAIRAVLAVIAFTAIACQLVLHVRAAYSAANFFSYFTNLSNLFAAAVLLVIALRPSSKNATLRDTVRFISAVNMTVVGVVFSMLLRGVDLGDLLPWVNFVLHYLMPVAIVADWLFDPPTFRLNARHMGLSVLFPFTYLIYVLVRGANVGWYPYWFLNPEAGGGYGSVAAYSTGVAAVFFLAGWGLLVLGNLRRAN